MGAAVRHGSDVAAVRARLSSPQRVCSALGLLDGYRPGRQAGGGLLIRCPSHRERTPSCSVTLGTDGTVRAHCFGCGWGGDVIALVAAARGLDVRRDFKLALREAAELAGLHIEAGATPRGSRRLPAPPPATPAPPPAYPPAGEVAALWDACVPVTDDAQVAMHLEGRSLPPDVVALFDLARALPPSAAVPTWARCGQPWPASGHRIIVPVFDASGVMRSLRAWAVTQPVRAKRVAPAGFSTTGLVMADATARMMLASGAAPEWFGGQRLDVIICEGEPDFVTWATRTSDANEHPPAVLGVLSAAWSSDVAARVPGGSRVALLTHDDDAGHRYAADIARTLAGRCEVRVRKRKDA